MMVRVPVYVIQRHDASRLSPPPIFTRVAPCHACRRHYVYFMMLFYQHATLFDAIRHAMPPRHRHADAAAPYAAIAATSIIRLIIFATQTPLIVTAAMPLFTEMLLCAMSATLMPLRAHMPRCCRYMLRRCCRAVCCHERMIAVDGITVDSVASFTRVPHTRHSLERGCFHVRYARLMPLRHDIRR